MSQDNLKYFLGRLRGEGANYSAYNAAHNFLKGFSVANGNLAPLKLFFLRNLTIEGMVPVIVGEMALCGVLAEVSVGEYDNIQQEIMDPQGPLRRDPPDVIMLSLWLEGLAPQLVNRFASLSAADADLEVERVLSTIKGYLAGIRRVSSRPILLNNFPLINRPTSGVLENRGFGFPKVLHDLNAGLENLRNEFGDAFIVDFATQCSLMGAHHAHDDRYWHMAKAPFTPSALVELGREYCRYLRIFTAKVRKCLVLDCDGTLWGGVVGEDGLNGIKLGKDFPGSSYYSFQQEILNLHDRGVILALCSKNNEADVLEVLRNHPEMLIREQHLAAWAINWDDKAANLIRIAQQLNIGLDSLVFVDDSPFECESVRSRLPEVEVVLLPKTTASYRRMLSTAGLFDSLSYTKEDRTRTQMYRHEADRKKLRDSADSLEEFLQNLGLKAEVGRPSEAEVQRIAQLTQKTNQFTLTTRRYTENQILGMMKSGCHDVIYLKLKDSLDDLGLVGVAIMKHSEDIDTIEIDSFLLSCRALGRGAEDALMSRIVSRAKEIHPASILMAKFIRTSKNSQVADFYTRFGFEKIIGTEAESHWRLAVSKANIPVPKWLEINERGR